MIWGKKFKWKIQYLCFTLFVIVSIFSMEQFYSENQAQSHIIRVLLLWAASGCILCIHSSANFSVLKISQPFKTSYVLIYASLKEFQNIK